MGLRRLRRWDIYLEVDDEGRCIGHVAALPGCFARAASRDAVERQLPDAIRRYLDWLDAHDEPAPRWNDGDSVRVVGMTEGVGPFDPGDAAMLLPDERLPLTDEDLERSLRIAGHSRAELLELVADLDDAALDWKPHAEEMTIREILRHVGNAEDLPPEWDDDDQLPLFAFLEIERRTVFEQLRSLPESARAEVFHPSVWTRHPEEPWTARKALRRMLEHEREHLGHIRAILTTIGGA